MKLICCIVCEDVFKLTMKPRRCECGRIAGYYINRREAVVSPEAVSVAIGNGSFLHAVSQLGHDWGRNRPLSREEWQSENRFLAWVRPNSGSGNPHTTVVPLEEIKVP
jgi:hypothetical protein